MDIKDLADEILKAVPTGTKYFNRSDHYQLLQRNHVDTNGYHSACEQLQTDGYLDFKQHVNQYHFTGQTEEFIRDGCYAGQRQREKEKRIAEADDRQLSRMVSESTLEVNSSVIDTNKSVKTTNDSVQLVNQSVMTLNTRTDKVYTTQTRLGIVTILVAVAAVGISVLDYSTNDEVSSLSKLLREQTIRTDQLQDKVYQLQEALMREREKNHSITLTDSVSK